MFVDKLQSKDDIIRCVDLYLSRNDENFVRTSKEASYRNLFNKVRLNKFVRVVKDSSEIIAWIYADAVVLEHTDYVTVQQMYFGSSVSGVKAVRCIRLLHDAMIEYAKSIKAEYCSSAGSPYDVDDTFVRVLEKSGWTRRGYLAVLPLAQGVPRLGEVGGFRGQS